MIVCVCVCLSDGLHLSILSHPFLYICIIHQSTSCRYIHLSIYLPPVSLSIHSSINTQPIHHLVMHLSIHHPSIHLFTSSSFQPSNNPSIQLSIHLHNRPIYPFIYGFHHQSNHMPIIHPSSINLPSILSSIQLSIHLHHPTVGYPSIHPSKIHHSPSIHPCN